MNTLHLWNFPQAFRHVARIKAVQQLIDSEVAGVGGDGPS